MQAMFKISLVTSIFGILLLLFISNNLEPKLTEINKINERLLNQRVKISGSVFKIRDKETFQILSVKDKAVSIDVLCECKNETIKNFQEIIVIGKVQEYKNHLQIQAEKIIEKN